MTLYRTRSSWKRLWSLYPSKSVSPTQKSSKTWPINRNLVKDWNASYERLTKMVVPRSARYGHYYFPSRKSCPHPYEKPQNDRARRRIHAIQRSHFQQDTRRLCQELPNQQVSLSLSSCRTDRSTTRFIVRDFVYSEAEIAKQHQDLEVAAATEKELWVTLSIIRMGSCPLIDQYRPNSFDWHAHISPNPFKSSFTSKSSASSSRACCDTVYPPSTSAS